MSENNVENSSYVYSSRYVDSSSYVYSSSYVDSSSYVYSSRSVDSSSYVYSSRSVYSSSSVFFCHQIKKSDFKLWNKQVPEDRFWSVRDKLRTLLADKSKPDFINSDSETAWTDMWKSVSADIWREIAKIDEFDKEITEKIIGFELTCLDEKSCEGKIVEIDGRKYKLQACEAGL